MMVHNHEHLYSLSDQSVVVIYITRYITSGGGLGEGLGGDGAFVFDRDFLACLQLCPSIWFACNSVLPHTDVCVCIL